MKTDQRKHKRYIFSTEEPTIVTVSEVGSRRSIEFRLLNISEGGVEFAAAKEIAQGIEVGSELYIMGFNGTPHLQQLKEVPLKVSRIMNHKVFVHLYIVCEFCNLPEQVRLQISALVDSTNHYESIPCQIPGKREMNLGLRPSGNSL